MRTNSGSGKSENNLNDPTLRDREKEKGSSGEAATATNPPGHRHKGSTG